MAGSNWSFSVSELLNSESRMIVFKQFFFRGLGGSVNGVNLNYSCFCSLN